MDQNSQICYDEDEIDLKELFKTIWKYKKFIAIFVIIITSLTTLYIVMKPNIYRVDSILKIGYYRNSNTLLENPQTLVEELKFIYDVKGSSHKKSFPFVDKVNAIKKAQNLIQISVLGLSKDSAKNLIEKVDKNIVGKHLQIIDKYKKNIQYTINTYQKELNAIENTLNIKKEEYEKNIQKAQNIAKQNPSVAIVFMMEVLKQKDELVKMQNKVFQLTNLINREKMKLLSINIKPTKVIKIIVYKNHVKPKRKLVVVVAFITSFILAIFLVFFMEFVKGFKEESQTDISSQ